MRSKIKKARRLVLKVGSTLVTGGGKGLDQEVLNTWAAQISELRAQGKQIVLVSSGAVAVGVERLGWVRRPVEMHALQAAAAVGQMGLVDGYEKAFTQHGLKTAQVLLTHEDLSDRTRYLNARSTLATLIELGVVPVINENDTVVTDEIKFGDNDTLGALVANLIEADLLILLTDQPGLFTADPRNDPDAVLISQGNAEDPQYESMAGGAGSGIGKGGMLTKIRAARRAARSGAHTCIASGLIPSVLTRLLDGEEIGTLLYASSTPLQAKKQWLADHLQLGGKLMLDDGAVRALLGGRSLLPVGVSDVEGEFRRGAAVACFAPNNREIARGLINYNSTETARIIRKPSNEIRKILGYDGDPELIHRNNMVVVGK